jgi:hypothetical protein
MDNYGIRLEQEQILVEQENYTDKPPKFKNQTYPYSSLPNDRDFERLLYYIFQKERDNKELLCRCDEVVLMQGTKERGRDISLKLGSENVGLVQCKKYTKPLTRNELGKEMLKFILFYLNDNQLISDLEKTFYYYIAVSSDIDEKGKNLISEVNDDRFDQDEICKWIEGLKKEYTAFKKIIFENQKEDILTTLEKINVIPLISTDLDARLARHGDIIKLFFEVDSVANIETFEKLLIEREKQAIKLKGSLNKIEKKLEEDFPYLFLQLAETKQKTEDLINQYSTHFIEYSDHKKCHGTDLGKIVSGILLQEEVKHLNEHEMYILANAAYLTDIGVCQPREILEEKYESEFLNYQKLKPFHSFEDYIQLNHYKISHDFINTNAELLGILEEYTKAIALVAQAHYNIKKNIEDQSKYEFEYSIDCYSTNAVRLPYLAYLILVADNIDIENLNSKKILNKYIKYPHFIVSKSLWEEEKVKPKLKPQQKGERLYFEGTIKNQLLYLGISDHLHQLEQILKDCHKLLKKAPGEIRFGLKFIENNIESPFKDGIGFAIDYKNIIHTFMGKKIYQDEYVAIRELIQNALDSCELKNKNEEEYTPEIVIELVDGDLIVQDNALGMDKYIVEKYFAKLGSSYYCDNNIQNSIGQFGVGVFSYFMLCDSFTVETKMKQTEGLNFIVSQEAPYQFYFEENPSISEGARVIVHLKDGIDLTIEKLINFVETTFKHVKIPLIIKSDKQRVACVVHKDYSLSKDSLIEDIVEIVHQQKFSEYEFYHTLIENEEFEGCCGIFFPKHLGNSFSDIRRNYIENKKGVNIFQKGVFIQRTGIRIIGEINIKKVRPLRIDRTNFEDASFLGKIFEEFENKLVDITFSQIHDESRFIPTLFYLLNYSGSHSNEQYKFLGNYFYVQVFNQVFLFDDKQQNLSFDMPFSKLKDFSELLLIPNKKDLAYYLSIIYAIPCTLIYPRINYHFILEYLRSEGFIIQVVNDTNLTFLIASKIVAKPIASRIPLQHGELITFCNSKLNICDTKLCSYLDDRPIIYFNINHPIIKLWADSYPEIESSRELSRLFQGFIEQVHQQVIGAFYTTDGSVNKLKIYLAPINPYLDKINQLLGTSFHLSKNDFPEWMHSKISD